MRLKYKLISNSKYENNIEQILCNRGISQNNIDDFIKPNKRNELDYNKLDNMDKAVECFMKHVENGDEIFIIVDSDTDGFCSSAILINYLRSSFKNIKVNYGLHTGKQHGFSEDIKIPKNCKLVISPDGGSNDYSEHKKLKEEGIDIIVLDHHEIEHESKDAIIVNNQLSKDYSNKVLCGTGVVYKFLQALDDELWQNKAKNYLDLVALATIGDSMDIRQLENRYYIYEGLNNINNKMFSGFINNAYNLKNVDNISMAFLVVPLVNAMIRIGKQEEKEFLFKAFLEEYEEFQYTPRGKNKTTRIENTYERAYRLCTNTKGKQDRMREKAMKLIEKKVEEYNINQPHNKIMIIDVTNEVDYGILGVVAIKVASKYKKPCLLIRKKKDNTYGGSARIHQCDIDNLKDIINESGIIRGEGHQGAFGLMSPKESVGKDKEYIDSIYEYINEELKDIDLNENTYLVDFILKGNENIEDIIYDIDELQRENCWGKGVAEPSIAVENIKINSSEISFMGNKNDTIKFEFNGIEYLKFKVDDNDPILSKIQDWNIGYYDFTLSIVGKTTINNWVGMTKPQIIIDNYILTKVKKVEVV